MHKLLKTYRKPALIYIEVRTVKPEKIRVLIQDKFKPDTIYTDRYKTINGVGKFYIRMPISGYANILFVKNMRTGTDSGFAIDAYRITELKLPNVSSRDKKIIDFVNYISANMNALSEGVYMSDCGQYRIDLKDKIRSRESKKVLSTPARINSRTHIIDASKDKMKKYTVPMRAMVLDHEIAHIYKNNNQYSEEQADYNGLKLYTAAGFPRVEAAKAFDIIFMGADSKKNRQRHKLIQKRIYDFQYKHG